MRSSGVEGQHAPRVKQTPPPGNSGATAVPAGAIPLSPHINSSSSPRPQSSATSLPIKSPSQLIQRGASSQSQSRNSQSQQSRTIAGPTTTQVNRTQLQKSSSSSSVTSGNNIHQRSNSTSSVQSSSVPTKGLNPVHKNNQARFSQSQQLQKNSTGSSTTVSKSSLVTSSVQGSKSHQSSVIKQNSSSSKISSQATNPPNFGEYDDQEWDVGVGHLIIDLDADIAQADRGKMSGISQVSLSNSSPSTQATEDKHSLKMKIKRTKPPTKTSEAKHEIVKADVSPLSSASSTCPSAIAPQGNALQNGLQISKEENGSTVSKSSSVPNSRAVYKKEKRRLDMNGMATTTITITTTTTTTTHSCSSVQTPRHPIISNPSASSVISSGLPLVTLTSSTSSSSVSSSSATFTQSLPVTATSTPLLKVESTSFTGAINSEVMKTSISNNNAHQSSTFRQAHDQSHQMDTSCPPALKKIKLTDDNIKQDACVGTSVGTITEPDCLGPCEPGSSVTLEGIVWHETDGGVLVVNVTWRGKTYVGTLLDCTKHDWAPPRFCDSPTSDLESRTPKGRAKRGRSANTSSTLGSVAPSTSTSSTSAPIPSSSSYSTTLASTPSTTQSNASDLIITETRSGKLRQASTKGRNRGGGAVGAPSSPIKEILSNKRKGRENETSIPITLLDASKVTKKARLTPKGITGSLSPPTEQQATIAQDSSSNNEIPRPASSQLIECPEPNCNKKYKHINGLKYHQSHAHSGNRETSATPVEENGESRSMVDGGEIEESEQPSPKQLLSKPVDKCTNDIVKPSVLKPAVVMSSSNKGDSFRVICTLPTENSISTSKQSNIDDKLLNDQVNSSCVQADNLTNNNLAQHSGALHENTASSQVILNHPNKPYVHSSGSVIETDSSQHGGIVNPSQTVNNQSVISTQLKTLHSDAKLQPSHIPSPQHQIIQKSPLSTNISHTPTYTLSQVSQAQTSQALTHLSPHLQLGASTSPKQLTTQSHAVLPQQMKGNGVISNPTVSKLHLTSGQPNTLGPGNSYSVLSSQNVAIDTSKVEMKIDGMVKVTTVPPSSALIGGNRPTPIVGNIEPTISSPSSTHTVSVSAIPHGTPLSSLPGSTITSLKVKNGMEEDLGGENPKDLANGLPSKAELDLSATTNRDDARSPAYSDISDANESTVIDGDNDGKDFKDEKKGELGMGGAPPYPYGLYYGAYGQSSHPYLMPPLQHSQFISNKPPPPVDLKDKSTDKDKKEFLPMPGGNEYVKIPSQYLYSYSHLYPGGYSELYMRDADKSKLDHENVDDSDKGPTDLSRTSSLPSSDKDSVASERFDHTQKEPSGGIPPERRVLDLPLPYRYVGPYDPRVPIPPSIDKPLDPKTCGPRPLTPSPRISPNMNSTNGASNKDEKEIEKRSDLKPEGVKPTMETTGPPPPPTSSAYYPPFPYSHVPFDPYRPPLMPGMHLPGGLPPYLAGPPPGLGGLRYPIGGVPNCPEDLSSSGPPPPYPPGLYSGSHKMAELQERALKSPSSYPASSVGSSLPVSGGNPPFSGVPHCLSPSVSSPGVLPSTGNSHQSHLIATSHLPERKTPPVGMRFPPHPSLPEGYSYPFFPTQFPPHFAALGVNTTGLPAVAMGGPGTPPNTVVLQPK